MAETSTKSIGIAPSDVHVLLVDDERLSRTVISTLLTRCNYHVTVAESGAQAMQILRSSAPGTFQLVLTVRLNFSLVQFDCRPIQFLHCSQGNPHIFPL